MYMYNAHWSIRSRTSLYLVFTEELAGRAGMRLEEAIGRVAYSSEVDEDLIEKSNKAQILYVPLPLWFSKYQVS